MTDSEKPKRSRGQHFKKNEVKAEILNYILNREFPVLESDLKEHLHETFGTRDVKTKKIHLRDLQKLQCVKKISNSDSEDKWEIDSLGHLNSIKENFKQIAFNCYKKAIEIILVKFTNLKSIMVDLFIFPGRISGDDITDLFPVIEGVEGSFVIFPVSINEHYLRKYLEMSPTFFDMCMSTNVEILYDRWVNLSNLTDYLDFYVDHQARNGISINEVRRNFYIKELPFLAFSHCVYMDILKGENQTTEAHSLVKRRYMEILAGYP